MVPKLKVFLGVVVLCIPLDQATKWWIATHVQYGGRIPVVGEFFSLTYVRNPGAAFSLFSSGPSVLRLGFFIGVSVVAIVLIVSFLRRLAPGDRLSALSLGLVFSGAAGNLIDRVVRGEVVDFLHFLLWGGYSWPDFNLADSFIVVGVALLVIELLATEGERRADPAGGEPPS